MLTSLNETEMMGFWEELKYVSKNRRVSGTKKRYQKVAIGIFPTCVAGNTWNDIKYLSVYLWINLVSDLSTSKITHSVSSSYVILVFPFVI